MTAFHVAVGEGSSFSKTVGETDVYMFAGITGDFAPNHVNQSYMEKSHYKQRIAHGALLVGFMSTASTLAAAHRHERLSHQRHRPRAPARHRRHQDHQPGRRPGGGRDPSAQMGPQFLDLPH